MGKPTGFLEYERQQNTSVDPLERIKNFNEFHTPLTSEERKKQGARCMNCGVPFCQSGMVLNGMKTGCPLHNLIPEWNHEIYTSNYKHALSRLLKTSNFPEFTGRVCPALCECACMCGLDGQSLTVKDNELFIIENAFANGYMKPREIEVRSDKKIAVIGSGPAGLAVADMLNYRGHNVTVFERDDRVGGLLMYGIPNMKLEKSVVDRRIDLMRAEGVKFVTDADMADKEKAENLINEYDAVVLCVGAKNPRAVFSPEIMEKDGMYYAVDFLTENTKSLLNSNFEDKKYPDVSGKDVVIIGGGDTGNDCVGTCVRHGAKSIVQLEMMPKPPTTRGENNPWPEYPKVLKVDYGQEEAIAVYGKDPREYQKTATDVTFDKDGKLVSVTVCDVAFEGRRPVPVESTGKEIKADVIIVAAGFLGTEKSVADAFGIELDARTNVKTDNYKTSREKVFAAGDTRTGQSLVVSAIADARACAKEVDTYLMGFSNMI